MSDLTFCKNVTKPLVGKGAALRARARGCKKAPRIARTTTMNARPRGKLLTGS
jgi:hypothetical protein